MTYKAKKPRKRRLVVKLEKAYRISIVDENEEEWAEDWCFGTREDALREGQKLLEQTIDLMPDPENVKDLKAFLPEQEVNPMSCIYWAMNSIGGAK